jgi:hypothetical protein
LLPRKRNELLVPKRLNIEEKTNLVSKTVHESERKRKKTNSKIKARAGWFSVQFRQDETKRDVVLTLSNTKRKQQGCSKILEERSEAKGISPTLSKSKVKRIGVTNILYLSFLRQYRIQTRKWMPN